jgi:drug/metabolite transporter (DMT)-like permease
LRVESSASSRTGLLQIHVAAILAGFTGLFGKLLTVGPAVIVAGRTIIGCLALALAAVVLGSSLRLQKKDVAFVTGSGVLLALHWFSFFQSIQVSTVAIGVLSFATFPLFVTFLEPLVFRERLHRSDIVTAIVVVAGLVLVTPSLDLGNRTTQGVLWGVLSGFTIAGLTLINRSFMRDHSAMAIAFYQQAGAALCVLPFALVSGTSISQRSLLLLLLLGVVFTALLQVLAVASLRHIRAQTASVIIALEPVYGVLFAIFILGEIPTARTILGGFLICGAVFGATLKHATLPSR